VADFVFRLILQRALHLWCFQKLCCTLCVGCYYDLIDCTLQLSRSALRLSLLPEARFSTCLARRILVPCTVATRTGHPGYAYRTLRVRVQGHCRCWRRPLNRYVGTYAQSAIHTTVDLAFVSRLLRPRAWRRKCNSGADTPDRTLHAAVTAQGATSLWRRCARLRAGARPSPECGASHCG